MNRGVLQSSLVQQMMVGNPNWWNINSMRSPLPQSSPFLPSNIFPQYPQAPSFLLPSNPHDNQQELPESWKQLLLGGVDGEDDHQKGSMGHFQASKLESWEEQMLNQDGNESNGVDVKQENSASSYVYGQHNDEIIQQQATNKPNWSHIMSASSPSSCITTFSNNMLDFSNSKADARHPPPDRSSECNSTTTCGTVKKARVTQSSSNQSTIKVRKEKLGDRVTALHQLVSPFGKTDTASVLLEAIGYIRFLQSQIEALSLPYLGSGSSANVGRQQHSVQGERDCIFPEDPGQLLNENCLKRKGATEQGCEGEGIKELRSKGLCLVPVSCTMQVGSDNGADYWSPAFGGGFP